MSCVLVALEYVNQHIIIAYTYTPNALRDAVELDAFNATFFPKSNVPQSTLYVLHLNHFASIQDGSSCKAALEFST